MDELVDFNIDMMKLIKKIEFKKVKCTFQTKQMSNTKKTSATISCWYIKKYIYIYIYIYDAEGP